MSATQTLRDCDQHPGCVLVHVQGDNEHGPYSYETHLRCGDPRAQANPDFPLEDKRTRPVTLWPLDPDGPPVHVPAPRSLLKRVLSVF